MNNIPLVLSMALVTYIPRLVPLLMVYDRRLPGTARRFLTSIPYAALGALIIPGAIKAVPEMPQAGWIGLGAALGVAWFKKGLVLPVLVSVLATFCVLALSAR